MMNYINPKDYRKLLSVVCVEKDIKSFMGIKFYMTGQKYPVNYWHFISATGKPTLQALTVRIYGGLHEKRIADYLGVRNEM
jgi:hypothetical protein